MRRLAESRRVIKAAITSSEDLRLGMSVTRTMFQRSGGGHCFAILVIPAT